MPQEHSLLQVVDSQFHMALRDTQVLTDAEIQYIESRYRDTAFVLFEKFRESKSKSEPANYLELPNVERYSVYGNKEMLVKKARKRDGITVSKLCILM